MFEFFRKHTRLLLALLVLLIIPSFVFLGLENYMRMNNGTNQPVATIDGPGWQTLKITQAEWDNAHREQVQRIRQQMPDVDGAMLDAPGMRQQTLDGLIRDKVMLTAAERLHLVTTDERLQRLFVSDPQFATLRNPDGSVNRDFLAARGMSSETFAQLLRRDFTLRQVMAGIGGSAFATDAVAARAFDALLQQREIQLQRINPAEYAAKIQPTDPEIDAYYADPKNADRFRAPEQTSIEYVVLDAAAIEKQIQIPEEELRKYYSENAARYTTPQERRASHILVKVDAKAPAAERERAKAKAEAILARVKAQPTSFADEARKNSDDPGSRANGGDLDFVARGAMVKPFEDAVFSLAPGETSGLVETEFGYHIVRVTAVRGGEKRSFEQVRGEIEAEARKQQAQRRFAEAATDFSNQVYEQPDSLQPAAEKFGLTVQKASGIRRNPPAGTLGPLANPKLLEALFSAESLRTKRNTEAVETGPSQLVSARVVDYQAARVLPLAEVRGQVREAVIARRAAEETKAAGEARLEVLRKAPDTVVGPSAAVSRANPQGLPGDLLDAVLGAPAETLPAFIGVDLGGPQGYAIAKITKVLGRDPIGANAGEVRAQYAQAWANAEADAYYAALKKRFHVEVKGGSTAAAAGAASAPR